MDSPLKSRDLSADPTAGWAGDGDVGMNGDVGMSIYDDRLTDRIIHCIIRVHQILGPGFVESVYRRALLIELRKTRLAVETEKEIVVLYGGYTVGRHRLDIVVEDKVILELKAVDSLNAAHYAQLRSYLKATGLKHGLLINFADDRADFRRVDPR
jgi:GxxExxY protein